MNIKTPNCSQENAFYISRGEKKLPFLWTVAKSNIIIKQAAYLYCTEGFVLFVGTKLKVKYTVVVKRCDNKRSVCKNVITTKPLSEIKILDNHSKIHLIRSNSKAR